jgi:hypothetical protein
MKEHLFLGIFSLILVLSLSFLFFSLDSGSLTGSVISDLDDQINPTSQNTINDSILMTKEDAILAIQSAEKVINQMAAENFSIVFVNDTLEQAKRVFEQAIYAEILRDTSSSDSDKAVAKSALYLIDWKNITFNSVLFYTALIEQRQKEAYILLDSLELLDKKAQQYENQGIDISGSLDLISQARQSFIEERYGEANSLIKQADSSLETSRAQSATFNSLASATRTFLQKYWPYVIMFFIFLWFIIYFIYLRVRVIFIRKEIARLKSESATLVNLIKDAQKARFQTNKISGIVYNIRIAKYKERQEKIKEILPVLQEKLMRYKKSRK